MNEYTPTTEDIREDFAFPWSAEQIGDRPARVAAFDRWLAEHDRVVAERAWDEGHLVHGADYRHNGSCRDSCGCIAVNPYRKEQENTNA